MTPWEKAREARRWWRELLPDEKMEDEKTRRPGNRAALARLRRAASPLEAADQEETIDLVCRLGGDPQTLAPIAVCAAVLAHVRTEDTVPVARRIGRPRGDPDQRPLVSPLRFRRFIQADTPEDMLIQFRRLVALADRTANVTDLAAALLDWSEERKRDWIFRYYAGTPPDHENDAPTPQPASEGAAP